MKRLVVGLILALAVVSARAEDEDDSCLACHGDRAELTKNQIEGSERTVDELFVDATKYRASLHAKQTCTGCHFEFEEFPHPADDIESVDCAECHEDAVEAFDASAHGVESDDGKERASCVDCHGIHDILRSTDRDARLHPLNVYQVCGKCHFDVDPTTATVQELMRDPYTDDAHAHGVLQAGLMGSATCVSCHGGHEIRAMGDPESQVSRKNVDQVCGKCHVGVVEQYRQSVHHLQPNGKAHSDGEEPPDLDEHKGATCTDCHKQHGMVLSDVDFRQQTVESCSECHDERAGSFRQSYHGKRHDLGDGGEAATCDSCHGAHRILPTDDPASMVHPDNLVDTCAKCHPGSHPEFANFLVHADPTDKENFPQLWWVYMTMTVLILGTLFAGCMHALMWLVRALAAGEWRRPPRPKGTRFVRRWPLSYIIYHMVLMTTVLFLAMTGLPLHYADQGWASKMMNFFGGATAAGWWHRVMAVVLAGLVIVFAVQLLWRMLAKKERGIFTGENTMMPRWKDFQDFFGNLRWFLFLGPRPKYSRWTYWEKFDFWAVFWGTFVIGLSGWMLWFPEIATRFVPGWFLNAAVIVHGFEALLDIAFIFTVHVFHANLRPDKFPMDTMFLSGALPEDEFRHERPIEHAAAVADGTLESMIVPEPARKTRIWAYVIGTAALALGFFFIVAMIIAVASNGVS